MSSTDKSTKKVLSPLTADIAPPRTEAAKGGQAVNSSADGSKKSRSYTDVLNRVVFSVLMAYVFLGFISLGAGVGVVLMLVISTTMFYEVTRINQRVRKERQLPSISILKWYFFTITMIFIVLYGMRDPLVAAVPSLALIYSKISFLMFTAVITGIVAFVLSLRKGMYRYQFVSFTWTIMTLMVIGAQVESHLFNITRGMIWFLLPVTCVINNDVWAYIWGKLFGRTKLLTLSPKKTVEGFAGAFLFTVIWAYWFCGFLSYFSEMYCPAVSFRTTITSDCVRDPIFIQREVELPALVQHLTMGYCTSIMVSTAQLHAIVLGTFASLVAPFGGFFASGLKRAFKIKDFGDLIPGHGGMTDRMDCQGLMGLFTFFYLRTYVFPRPKCPGSDNLFECAMNLHVDQRRSLMLLLQESL